MINKFKKFINENSNINSDYKLQIQGILDIKNVKYYQEPQKLNDYLNMYYIINENRPSYYDIMVVDNDMNILFGESININKFKYKIPSRIPSKKTFEIVNNETKKSGLVNETGKKIIIEPKYETCRDENHYWKLYNGEFYNYDLLTIVDYNGNILTKDNTQITYLNIDNDSDNIRIIFKIMGSDEKRYNIIKNLTYLSDFFKTDWKLKIDSEKFNL